MKIIIEKENVEFCNECKVLSVYIQCGKKTLLSCPIFWWIKEYEYKDVERPQECIDKYGR